MNCHPDSETWSDCTGIELESITKNISMICHPDPEFWSDHSRVAFSFMLGSFILLFCVKAFWVLKNYIKKRTIDPIKNLTLATIFAAGILVGIAINVDSKDISMEATFTTAWDSGFFLIVISIICIALYLMCCLFLKMFCFNIFRDQIALVYHQDPEECMQWYTLVTALLAVFFKNSLMKAGPWPLGLLNGTTSISIAMAAAVVVIKIGHGSVTAFGNFATMFHIILKKIPSYSMAVIILLHGFSFGFWILEGNLSCSVGQNFNDYFMSSISVLMMSFGVADFNFEGPFNYPEHKLTGDGISTVIFAYVLLSLMVLLITLGLLNLLLSTIIVDHKEGARQVVLYNLIYMAKYAMWLDYSRKLPTKILRIVTFGYSSKEPCILQNYINKKVEVEESVKYCAVNFCPRLMLQGDGCSMFWRDTEESSSGDHGHHFEPHFEWILRMLLKQPESNHPVFERQSTVRERQNSFGNTIFQSTMDLNRASIF